MTCKILLLVLLTASLARAEAFTTGSRRASFFSRAKDVSATLAEPSSSTIPSWEELQALLKKNDKKEDVQPLVTLFRDTNGWCPFCERVWLALEIKQIPYQEQLINLQDKPAWFKQMVPTALVPAVLLHTDQMTPKANAEETAAPERSLIWESLDILKALDEKFPDTPRLVLDDREDYLEARAIASKATTAGVQLLYGGRNGTVTEEERAQKKEAFVAALRELDAFLGTQHKEGPFCLGETVTGVDIEMIPTMERWRYQLPITANLNLYDADQFPNIVRWFDALDQYEP